MATLRELKGRIGSVASSEKITGAMKMISSAKMHKAEGALRQLQPYRKQIESILQHLLSADATFSSPLLECRDIKRVALCVWGSDDGLCGAYNVNIFKSLIETIEAYRKVYGQNVQVVIHPVGAKMLKQVRKIASQSVKIHTVDNVDSKSTGDDVKRYVDHMIDDFLSGEVDKVDMLYMQFQSVSRQRLKREQLLPVQSASFVPEGASIESNRPYLFEPDANTIFNTVLPMYLLSVGHDVFTENRASEQAARIMAMQSANDNAKKLLEQLQLEYNKLRQQGITNELLDIVGGQVR